MPQLNEASFTLVPIIAYRYGFLRHGYEPSALPMDQYSLYYYDSAVLCCAMLLLQAFLLHVLKYVHVEETAIS